MCGILAIMFCSDDSPAKKNRVLELSRRLKHRGPDWSGFHQYGDCFLCHQRLAIVDPTSGDQPLYNEDESIVVIVNGEIYNHKEIRKSLPTHTFRTESDCEVIPHLYEEYGEDFANTLDGVFSFVLLDKRDNSFIAGRDALGVAPLYIGWGLNGSVCFSSELKALNDECLHFECFPPGHLYSSKSCSFRQWYNPTWMPHFGIPSAPYDPSSLRVALKKAVEKRLMMDAPFGALLCGDLDSSLVASIAARFLRRKNESEQQKTQLHSFCVGLKGALELEVAKEVAEYLGTIHHEFYFTVQDAINAIDDVIYHTETYDVKTVRESVPMFLMSRKIKSLGVKMVISGEGSNEIFGGDQNLQRIHNKEDFHREICRKIKALHQYDCLRTNKATFAWGLEAEVPFLDKEFIEIAMSIDPEWKMAKQGRIEKWILRKAFDDEENPYLPQHILYGQEEKCKNDIRCKWIKDLQNHAEQHVSTKMMLNATRIFPYNTPATKEAYYYRMIFEKLFPQKSAILTVPVEVLSMGDNTNLDTESNVADSKDINIATMAAPMVEESYNDEQPCQPDSPETIISSIIDKMSLGTHAPEVVIRG